MAARDASGTSDPCARAPVTPPAAPPRRICSEDIECSGLTIPKAVQYLSSQDEKYQAIGAYYIQHTCFQDESAKQQVPGRTPAPAPPPEGPGRAWVHRLTLRLAMGGGWGHLQLAPPRPTQLSEAGGVLRIDQGQSWAPSLVCGAKPSDLWTFLGCVSSTGVQRSASSGQSAPPRVPAGPSWPLATQPVRPGRPGPAS